MLQNAVLREQYGNILGRTPQEVAPNDTDLTVWLENNRRAFAGERVEGEVELTVGGRRRHYHNVLVPIRCQDTIHGIIRAPSECCKARGLVHFSADRPEGRWLKTWTRPRKLRSEASLPGIATV